MYVVPVISKDKRHFMAKSPQHPFYLFLLDLRSMVSFETLLLRSEEHRITSLCRLQILCRGRIAVLREMYFVDDPEGFICENKLDRMLVIPLVGEVF